MRGYDPDLGPDLSAWRDLDEGEQIQLVLDHHRRAGVQLPNPLLHATIHVVVENQVAAGDEIPVGATLARLQREGLSRHDAVHAIGSVLAGHMYDLMRGPPPEGDPNAAYFEQLGSLTARGWLAEAE